MVPGAIIPAPVAAIRVAPQGAIIGPLGHLCVWGGVFGWLAIIVLFGYLENNRGEVLTARPLAPRAA